MYFDISITHNTLHHGGQSRGRRGEETSFILTPAQLHSINIIETDTRFWRLLLMTGKIIQRKRALQGYFMFLYNSRNNCFVNYFHYSNIIAIQQQIFPAAAKSPNSHLSFDNSISGEFHSFTRAAALRPSSSNQYQYNMVMGSCAVQILQILQIWRLRSTE